MEETEDEKKSVQSFCFEKIGWRVDVMEQGGSGIRNNLVCASREDSFSITW